MKKYQVICGLFALIGCMNMLPASEELFEQTAEDGYGAKTVHGLEITLEKGKIEIFQADRNGIRIELKNKANGQTVPTKYIAVNKKDDSTYQLNLGSGDEENLEYKIFLPTGIQKVSLRAGLSKVSIYANAMSCSVSVSQGDIEIRDKMVVGDNQIYTGMGKIYYEASQLDAGSTLKLKSSMGTISLRLPSDMSKKTLACISEKVVLPKSFASKWTVSTYNDDIPEYVKNNGYEFLLVADTPFGKLVIND